MKKSLLLIFLSLFVGFVGLNRSSANSYDLALYKVENNKVYYHSYNPPSGWDEVVGVDIPTYKNLDDKYISDKNFGYYAGVKVDGSDGSTFVNLTRQYAKDKSNVYYQGRRLNVNSVNDFVVLPYGASQLLDAYDNLYSFQFGRSSIFPDITENDEIFDALVHLKKNKIVSGFPDGTFKKDEKITRGAFTKIIINSKFTQSEIDLCDLSSNLFPDVPTTHSFAKYICVAKREGIVGGYSDGQYKPDNLVTLADGSKITVNTLYKKIEPGTGTDAFMPYLQYLSDQNAIPWTMGIIQEKRLSRGDMAEMVYRLITNNTSKFSVKFYRPGELTLSASEYYLMGFSEWVNSRDVQASDRYYEMALQKDPNYAPALSSYGASIGSFHNDLETGRKLVTKAMELDPNWTYAPFNLGILYSLEGDKENTLTGMNWVQFTINKFPNHPDIAHFKEMYSVMKEQYDSL